MTHRLSVKWFIKTFVTYTFFGCNIYEDFACKFNILDFRLQILGITDKNNKF